MRILKCMMSVVLVMALCICSCLWTIAYANTTNPEIPDQSIDYNQLSVITNPTELKKIIEEQELDVPVGYHLEKVEVFCYMDKTEQKNEGFDENIQPNALLYEIRNVRVSPNEFYYVNEYDSDWFYGPCSVSETYTRQSSVKIDIDTTIGNSTVSAAVGYSITDTYTKSKTFSASVASGKILNVRVHTNYKSTQFDIYNQWTGNLVERDAWTAKPIGLVFVQYTYSK